MKQIVLDIETTGLDFRNDRIIEIGCVELVNRRLTGKNLHFYINPECNINLSAKKIHGISNSFLRNKPKFIDIVNKFLNYIKNSEIIIHNANFDINFINMELNRIGIKNINNYISNVIDSLKIARKKFPGKSNSIDSLCKRYNIFYKERKYHGGLLDAFLLSKIYLALTKKQNNLFNNINTNNFLYKNVFLNKNKYLNINK